MRWLLPVIGAAGMLAGPVIRQDPTSGPPVIDMHVHSTTTTPRDLARLDALNVRYVFVSGLAADLAEWSAVDANRYLPSLVLPCGRGRALFTMNPCWEGTADLPDVKWLRDELQSGRIRGLGEMVP